MLCSSSIDFGVPKDFFLTFFSLYYGMFYNSVYLTAFLGALSGHCKTISYTLILTVQVSELSDCCVQTVEALNAFNLS